MMDSARSKQRLVSGRRAARGILSSLLGAGIATVVGFALPPAAFRTSATIEVGGAGTPLGVTLAQAALQAVVSKPVMLRAATSLIDTDVPVPDPGFAERVGVAISLTKAADRASRLEAVLGSRVHATPGQAPGSIQVGAEAVSPEAAAHIADAVAEAFVLEQEVDAAERRQERDLAAAKHLDGLRADARKAREHLAALGGSDIDPSQARLAATAQTAAAQTRLDAIRAIIESGSPPLSDRRDVPQTIEALQTTYLDLRSQLAKAHETLGERHTTVISLEDGVRRAAQNLTGEWKRLERLATGDLDAARTHEAALQKGEGPGTPQRAEVDAARRAVQAADAELERAQTRARTAAPDDISYRLLATAPVPIEASGWSVAMRLFLAVLSGFAAASLADTLGRRWRARAIAPDRPAVNEPATAQGRARQPLQASFFDRESEAEDALTAVRNRTVSLPNHDLDENNELGAPTEMSRALSELLAAIEDVVPRTGSVPAVMVAANEAAQDTMTVAIGLARGAADLGFRTLLIEAREGQPALAASADPKCEPLLVDALGRLRVALAAEHGENFLYVAPAFQNGARIAAALAKNDEVPFVDDIGRVFDLVVVDGGRAATAAAEGWEADAYLRVGRFASERDDERFTATLGASRDALIWTFSDMTRLGERDPQPAESVKPSHVVERTAERSMGYRARSSRRPGPMPTRGERRRVAVR